MSKAEKLQNHLKSADEPKKWKAYVIVAVGVLVGVGISSGLLIYADIENYLQENKYIVNLYDFYDGLNDTNNQSVFFVGSCIIGNSIYPPKINEILASKGYDINVYNLIYGDDIPLERSLEIQKIIDAKPSLVVFGITYRSITTPLKESRFNERTKLVYDRLKVREDSLYLFTESEKESITSSPNLFYYKTFLKSALSFKYRGKGQYDYTYDYFNDPYGETARLHLATLKNPSEILLQSNNPNDPWRPVVTNVMDRYKEALIYNVKTLQNENIPVVIINMPLHPLFSEKITDESRDNYFSLLNKTGAKIYDMEKDYGDEFFRSSHQAIFEDGALVFAPRMADLIIQELT